MFRFSFSSLHIRLIMLVLLVMTPALALTVYTGLEQREQSEEATRESALQMTRIVTAYQEELILRSRHILLELARVPAVRTRDSEECSAAFARLQEQYTLYTDMVAAGPDGKIFCSSSPDFPFEEPISVADRDWFQRSIPVRDFIVSDVIVSRVSGKRTQSFGYPVFDNQGTLQAVLMVGLDLNVFGKFIAQAQLSPGSIVTLVDGNGTILARYPESNGYVGQELPDEPLVEAMLQTRGNETVLLPGLDGESRLYAFSYMRYSAQGLYMGVGVPTSVAFGEAERMLARNLTWLGLIALAELLAAAVWGTFFILRPIKVLVEGTRRISAGELTTRIDANQVVGELHPLATSFNSMAETLEQHEINLREAEQRYRTLIEQIPNVVYTTALDASRTTFYISPRIESLLGVAATEWLEDPQSWIKYVHPEDRQRALDNIHEQFDSATGVFRCEYRMLTHDNHTVWVRDEGVMIDNQNGTPSMVQGTLSDITERKHAEEIIKMQQDTLRELSTPLLHIADSIMLMPLVGTLDSQRSQQMMTFILKGIEQHHARIVILDITGVAVVDTQVANALIQTARAIELLGARVLLTGVRPEVAQAMVGLGIDLSSIVTHSTLQNGIEAAFKLRARRRAA